MLEGLAHARLAAVSPEERVPIERENRRLLERDLTTRSPALASRHLPFVDRVRAELEQLHGLAGEQPGLAGSALRDSDQGGKASRDRGGQDRPPPG